MPEKKRSDNSGKAYRFLPLTLRLATAGGIATPIVLRGTPLPARRSQVFTTGADNQSVITIRVLIGESPIADKNLLLQSFEVTGIPDAPRGKPEVDVTFEVDRVLRVRAEAKERDSGAAANVEFDDAASRLTDDSIERLLEQAETERVEDEEVLKLTEAKNKADLVIDKAEGTLRRYQGKALSKEKCREIEELLAALGLALETGDAQKIRAAVDELESLLSSPTVQAVSSIFDTTDMFSQLFRDPQSKSGKSTQVRKPSSKSTRAKDMLAAPGASGQIGTIFGGGQFTIDPNLCFVLMPFSEQMQPVYLDHIRPAVEVEKLVCLRVDEVVGTGMITWDVWEKINRARLVVADLTGRNPNVFYEVGIAHALGKEVILLAQTMDDVPFDLKALRCIIYDPADRGMKEMVAKLRATIRKVMESA